MPSLPNTYFTGRLAPSPNNLKHGSPSILKPLLGEDILTYLEQVISFLDRCIDTV